MQCKIILMKMIKKLVLTFAFIALVTIGAGATTYAADEKSTTSEDISNTIIILNNLYEEGVLTEEEYLNTKRSLLNPGSVSDEIKGKKVKKNLTAVERKRLKEAEAKAKKELHKAQVKADREAAAEEKERIKAAKREACLEVTEIIGLSDDTPRGCQLIKMENALKKIKIKGPSSLLGTLGDGTTAAERKRKKEAEAAN